jgi:predicted TIM-barrel fold metal-dependent hydrolase
MSRKCSLLISVALVTSVLIAVPSANAYELNDSHLHVTNYVQEGVSLSEMLRVMGDKTGRAAVFGIPLQQKWDYFESGERRPDYYLLADAELYYYSFIDAMIAEQYRRLPAEDQARLEPMITGFNPTDMYAPDHIRRVLLMYPGTFTGIGEFSIHKEFVSSKVAGHTATLHNPALDRILDLAGEVGLVVILHNDIDTVRPASGHPAHFDDLRAVLRKHANTTIIWAHTGLGRFVKPSAGHIELLRELLASPDLSQVYFDISWDEVAKWIVANEISLNAWAQLLNDYPDRFLFGTDAVAPKTEADHLKTYVAYRPLFERLQDETAAKIKVGNFERIFDTARKKVRAWEERNALR